MSPRDFPISAFPQLELQALATTPCLFHMCSGELNLDPHAVVASITYCVISLVPGVTL